MQRKQDFDFFLKLCHYCPPVRCVAPLSQLLHAEESAEHSFVSVREGKELGRGETPRVVERHARPLFNSANTTE
jgi:hypothetical protein